MQNPIRTWNKRQKASQRVVHSTKNTAGRLPDRVLGPHNVNLAPGLGPLASESRTAKLRSCSGGHLPDPTGSQALFQVYEIVLVICDRPL